MTRIRVEEQLLLLKRQYLVERVMIDRKRLTRATTEEEAKAYYGDYDVVPFPKTGIINGYFSKYHIGPNDIEKSVLIGGGTSILDLIELFSQRNFYFVLHANEVAGFIHYSDLNQPYVRIPLYGIMQIVETTSWNKINDLIDEKDIKDVVTRSFDRLLSTKKKNERNNVGQGWIGVLNLPEILRLARLYRKNKLSDTEIEDIRLVRNKLAHPHGNLVDKKEDISALATGYKSCMKIIASA